MNREIKCRGKSVEDGDSGWVYGYYAYKVQDFMSVKNVIIQEDGTIICIDPETIGQFTGLYDKDGKEIYEDDILSLWSNYNKCWTKDGAEVIFSHEYVGGWVIRRNETNLTLGKRQNSLKILGNKFDNPELLKQ